MLETRHLVLQQGKFHKSRAKKDFSLMIFAVLPLPMAKKVLVQPKTISELTHINDFSLIIIFVNFFKGGSD